MAATEDQSLSLEEVKRRFVQAEESLHEIADSARSLQASSAQLDAARDALAGAAGQLSGYVEGLHETTGRLAGATAAIERIDPAALKESLATHAEQQVESAEALQQSLAALAEQQIEASEALKRLRTWVFVLLGIQIVAAAVITVLLLT